MKRAVLILFALTTSVASYLYSQITPHEAIAGMHKGINLGNTLEPPLEGGWNNPMAQEYYFDMYVEAGFACVRIPVRWDKHTSDVSPYEIDESWLQRVEEVLDWGLDRDLFIVVNAHHDNWIKEDYDNASYRDRFDSIWVQISERFQNKPEKLIFEIINEPQGLTKEQNDDLHQRVLSIIRRTNPTRLVMFQGPPWGSSQGLLEAAIPDPDDPYLIGSFHSYDPWPFGLEGTGSFGTDYQISVLDNKFAGVKAWSETNNIPVFLGEFACHKDADYASRMKHYQTYVELCQTYGFSFCTWDDGGNFGMMLRSEHDWIETKDILIYGSTSSPDKPALELFRDTTILLTWQNRVTDHDEIIIQRRTPSSDYENIDTLDPGESGYYDENLAQNASYHYRVIARYTGGDDHYSHPAMIYLPVFVPEVRAPFYGTPFTVPGIIEAEDFDKGGEGLSYHDSDDINVPGEYRDDVGVDIYDRNGDGYIIGNFVPGEWCEYSIDVESTDEYKVIAHIATFLGGGTFEIKIGDVSSGAMIAPTSESFVLTDTVSVFMNLIAGEQIMRVSSLSDPSFNIDKIEIKFRFLDTTGVGTFNQAPLDFKVFQNQYHEVVLQFENSTALNSLKIYSITGQLVYSVANPSGLLVLPGSIFTSGIYIARCESERATTTKRFPVKGH